VEIGSAANTGPQEKENITQTANQKELTPTTFFLISDSSFFAEHQ
jgi:hypothetical protein